MRKQLGGILVFCVLVASGTAARAACRPGDPTGYFEGTAQSKEAGALAVSVNLRCESGMYRGEVGTPVGRFDIRDGGFARGRLTLTFGGGAIGDQGTIELTVQGARASHLPARRGFGLVQRYAPRRCPRRRAARRESEHRCRAPARGLALLGRPADHAARQAVRDH